MSQRHQYAVPLASLLGGAALLVVSQVALAATSCTFTSASPVGFGAYEVFAALPNNYGVGSITVDCSKSGSGTFDVSLSTGQSNTYASRVMMAGTKILQYNLYTSAVRNVVWGDGTGGSQVMTVPKNKVVTFDIFGQIPAGQDAAVGMYTDSIIAVVMF